MHRSQMGTQWTVEGQAARRWWGRTVEQEIFGLVQGSSGVWLEPFRHEIGVSPDWCITAHVLSTTIEERLPQPECSQDG
jgi:hypothetical protein